MIKDHINCRSDLCAKVWAGVIAGIIATLMQILLWLIFTDDFPAILFRDAQLTAALVMGDSVLPPPATVFVMLTATLIHFTLSIVYAVVLTALVMRLDAIAAFSVGIGFGIALYIVNLYGFTVFFPWFVLARGWITLIAHVIFGITTISIYRWLNIKNVRYEADVH